MNDRERFLFTVQIVLAIMIACLAFWLALGTHGRHEGRTQRQRRHRPVPTDIKARSITGLEVPRCQLNMDDEKTTGTTNQVIPVFNIYDDPLKRRNAVEVPAQDLMDIDPPIAPVTTSTHGATRPSQDW